MQCACGENCPYQPVYCASCDHVPLCLRCAIDEFPVCVSCKNVAVQRHNQLATRQVKPKVDTENRQVDTRPWYDKGYKIRCGCLGECKCRTYVCSGCSVVVYPSQRLLCISGCPRVYGCHWCSTIGDTVVCFEHSAKCTMCGERYALRRNCVVRVQRIYSKEWACCVSCYKRVRAMVDSLILRTQLTRVVLDMIVVHAVKQ